MIACRAASSPCCVSRSIRHASSSSKPLTTMQLIKKLREEIQAPLNIVKAAATQAQPAGDYSSALEILKREMTKRGEKLVAKSIDRAAKEGWVIAARSEDHKSASLSVLNCETDFVAKSDKVVDLAASIGRQLASSATATSETLCNLSQDQIDATSSEEGVPLKEKLTESMSIFGESMRMTRATVSSVGSGGGVLGIHCHGGPSISKDVYLGRMGALVRIHSAERDLTDMADAMAREMVAQNPESLKEFWTLEKVGDEQGRSVRQWAGDDVEIKAWTRMEREA